MENMIEIAIDERAMAAHAIATAIEATPAFLPPVTIARADGRGALLYSSEGMTPIALYGTGPTGGFALCDVFELLYGYIRCMLAARDRLMDTRLLSSDPLRGVFAARARQSSSSSVAAVKAVWGADALSDEGEKICRVAASLAERERIAGAKISMERMIGIIRSEHPSLKDCLKVAESLCRAWNRIV